MTLRQLPVQDWDSCFKKCKQANYFSLTAREMNLKASYAYLGIRGFFIGDLKIY
jgi:hypothetical protein